MFRINAILADIILAENHQSGTFLSASASYLHLFLGMAKIFAEYFGGSLNLSSTGEKTTVELTIIRDLALAAENLK